MLAKLHIRSEFPRLLSRRCVGENRRIYEVFWPYGLGYALTERFVVKEGFVMSDTLAKYKIPDISLTPQITPIIVEHPTSEGPFGAKGVGEITSMPTAPAITNAIRRAVGVGSFTLPVDREILKTSLMNRGEV